VRLAIGLRLRQRLANYVSPPLVHALPPVNRTAWKPRRLPTPVTDALYARLTDEDVAAVRVAATPAELEVLESVTDDADLERLTLALGVHHQIPGVLERTGLRMAEPPEHIHSMARGWMAAGGSSYYADLVMGSVEAATIELRPGSRILDFGCSSGRVVRVLQSWRQDFEYFACDPNQEAIEWADDNLHSIAFLASENAPPLPYRDDFFELVYAISIWSHYAERAAMSWFDEMHRVLAPGGVLLVTVHGLNSALQHGANPSRVKSPELLANAAYEMLSTGYYFWDAFGTGGDWGVISSDWGEAYISPEWIVNMLAPMWEMLMYATGVVEGNQDLLVLRARKVAKSG